MVPIRSGPGLRAGCRSSSPEGPSVRACSCAEGDVLKCGHGASECGGDSWQGEGLLLLQGEGLLLLQEPVLLSTAT